MSRWLVSLVAGVVFVVALVGCSGAPFEPSADWTVASFPDASAASSDLSLVYSPSLGFAAFSLGTRHISTSPDGDAWTVGPALLGASTGGGGLASGLIAGVPAFVLSANEYNRIYTTEDGLGWPLQATTGGVLNGTPFAYSPSLDRWVASSTESYYAAGSDVLSWNLAATPSSWANNAGSTKRLVFGGSLVVALPSNQYDKALTSPDGIVWAESTLPFTAVWTGLAYSDADGWMATSSDGLVAVSSDGLTWTSATAANYVVNDLAVIGNLWAAPTEGGVMTSDNHGESWNRGAVGDATAEWKRIVAAGDRFIVGRQTGGAVELALSSASVGGAS